MDNTLNIITQLIKVLKIPVNNKSIKEELLKHPNNNTLLAISDLLTNWNINNMALQISIERLKEIPLPFITHTTDNEFLLVTKIDEDKITLTNHKGSKKVSNIETFNQNFSGSILIVQKDDNSGRLNLDNQRRLGFIDFWRFPTVIIGSSFILVLTILLNTTLFNDFNLQLAFSIVIKIIGFAITTLLIMQSINENNPLIQKLCGNSNKAIDCNAILSSKGSKITKELSWSEFGFFYFAGSLLVLLFNSHNTNLIYFLGLLNLISLPYTLFAIFYQWQAKKWCLLCCTVHITLWLEFYAFFPRQFQSLQMPTLNDWVQFIIAMSIPVLFWIMIKPYLLLTKKFDSIQEQLSSFKYNEELFNKLLSFEPQYSLLSEKHSIILGSNDAEHTLTMVSNPYCEPCAKAHKLIELWIENQNEIKLQIIFSINNVEIENKIKMVQHLMSLQYSKDNTGLKKAIDDWYYNEKKDYNIWVKQQPCSDLFLDKEWIGRQAEWCYTTGIKNTPTFFINGKRLPNHYEPLDLKYLI